LFALLLRNQNRKTNTVYKSYTIIFQKKIQDGKRCGKTIAQLFEKAKDPNKVFIGLIEQNSETDLFCLEAYCQEHGVDIYQKKAIRKDTTKILTTTRKKSCPRMNQIRTLAVHHVDAKGPSYARSLARKVLGNEEFCLQIDAHTDVVSEWDDKLQHEWAATGNEFGIISTVPAALSERETLAVNTVPRQCAMNFLETGVPVSNTYRIVWCGVGSIYHKVVVVGKNLIFFHMDSSGIISYVCCFCLLVAFFLAPPLHTHTHTHTHMTKVLHDTRRWQGGRLGKATLVSWLVGRI
jgi:Glycosyltransferase (GlcNAc)